MFYAWVAIQHRTCCKNICNCTCYLIKYWEGTHINYVECHCGCLLLSLLQANSNSYFAFQYCGNWRKRMIFNLPTFWTGSLGYTRLPSAVHCTWILSPNIASLASLATSVAILDLHRGLGYFESTLATKVRLGSTFSISEESRTFVFEWQWEWLRVTGWRGRMIYRCSLLWGCWWWWLVRDG